MGLTQIKDPTRDRYRAYSANSVWKVDVVRSAAALVVGAGALGNEVAKNLAMMGVRLVIVVDRDTVEVANLTRSVFFREADHGRMKAEVLAERLTQLNPDVKALALQGDIDEVLGLGLVRRMDMIFSCLDNRLARRSINRMCQKLAKPWVDGSMENLLGDVTVYLPDAGPCYECTLTRNDKEIIAKATSCQHVALQNIALGKVPTTSTMGAIISALQVQEALKLLHGGSSQPRAGGGRLVVNCGINDFYTTRAERKDDCEGHFRYGEICEMHAWHSQTLSAREMLVHFEQETGQRGHLRLGREVVTGLRCHRCGADEDFGHPLRSLKVERVSCQVCGAAREPVTTNTIKGDEPYADRPLSQLGIPRLDILEVRGAKGSVWYELTGDLAAVLPEGDLEDKPSGSSL